MRSINVYLLRHIYIVQMCKSHRQKILEIRQLQFNIIMRTRCICNAYNNVLYERTGISWMDYRCCGYRLYKVYVVYCKIVITCRDFSSNSPCRKITFCALCERRNFTPVGRVRERRRNYYILLLFDTDSELNFYNLYVK